MRESNTARRRRTRLAAPTSLVLVGGLALVGCSSEPEADGPGPAEVLAQYEEARNANDFDALRALYADDAVITGHPLDLPVPQIADVDRVMTLEQNGAADAETRYVDVEVSGDQATFTQIYRFGRGCKAAPGVQVTVENGKITSYTWTVTQPCDREQLAELGIEE